MDMNVEFAQRAWGISFLGDLQCCSERDGLNANKKLNCISYPLAFRLYGLCLFCCISLGRCRCWRAWRTAIHTAHRTAQTWSKSMRWLKRDIWPHIWAWLAHWVKMGNTQLRHFYAKFRLPETGL